MKEYTELPWSDIKKISIVVDEKSKSLFISGDNNLSFKNSFFDEDFFEIQIKDKEGNLTVSKKREFTGKNIKETMEIWLSQFNDEIKAYPQIHSFIPYAKEKINRALRILQTENMTTIYGNYFHSIVKFKNGFHLSQRAFPLKGPMPKTTVNLYVVNQKKEIIGRLDCSKDEHWNYSTISEDPDAQFYDPSLACRHLAEKIGRQMDMSNHEKMSFIPELIEFGEAIKSGRYDLLGNTEKIIESPIDFTCS